MQSTACPYRLPEPVASFGAAVEDNWLYVYSGHTGDAHEHSKANLSQRFQRIDLRSPGAWESLPLGPGLQSAALVAHGKFIYRVGGLSARNEPGAAEDLVSVTDFARFDPSSRTWTELTPLPVGRSSHDAVVVGDRLYVVGGWDLAAGSVWHTKSLWIDLRADAGSWIELPEQPFKRRALAVAECQGKLYAIGGMGADNKPSHDVACFDLGTQKWSIGPAVPGDGMNGFGCSAQGTAGHLYLSTMDGRLYRLAGDGRQWQDIGTLREPRFFHRLVSDGAGGLLAVGGASHAVGHLDSIEHFRPVAAR
ncbi:MAG TPA: hypothetical protein VIK18_11910 [Pirellulales bacterium]